MPVPLEPVTSTHALVGATRSQLARRIARGRPMRSESGPQNQAAIATAATTAEIVSPARDGETSKFGTMLEPFRPCSVSLDGHRLPGDAWSYDRRERVLKAAFRTQSGALVAASCS